MRIVIILNMNTRPEWLIKFRVLNVNKDRRNKKAVYLDRSNNLVVPTHFNLAGGTYSVPRDKESEFYREYIRFVFGDEKGKLAITESPIVSCLGISYSSVFIDFDLQYPITSTGR